MRKWKRNVKFCLISLGICCLFLLTAIKAESMFQRHFGETEKEKQWQIIPWTALVYKCGQETLNNLYDQMKELPAEQLNSPEHPADPEADLSPWFLPQADQCMFTDSEKEELKNLALTAAEQVRDLYQNAEYEEGPGHHFYIRNFTEAQRREAVSILKKAGFVSVTADANMENYEKVEEFYQAYLKKREAMVTVFEINLDGLLGASSFLYRDGRLQTYYVGIEWQAEPASFASDSKTEGFLQDASNLSCSIKETLVSNLSELKLTEKGYLIYAYEEPAAHASLRQCWRVKPLSDTCRELTEKYISGLSYVNYNVLVTNWDSGNAEDILMPCMFEDIYRMDTGEFLKTEEGRIPAELYEQVMTGYFPVSAEQVRKKCGYEESTASYPYEMIYAVPYPPFGEVVDYEEHGDGSITLFVDGVWADYNSDFAFRNEIVVMPFSDGTFRYLSNKVEQKELELPAGGNAE